jgi:lipopolysaccharide transport system permease protein
VSDVPGLIDSSPGFAMPAGPALAEPRITRIAARSGWAAFNVAELWRYRELLYYLTQRDIKVRYKQTVLGVGWALLQPAATMIVLWLVIGRMGGANQSIANYPLFVFAGVLPWTFFANAIANAGLSVVQNQHLVTKVYFPRLLVPLSSVGAALFDCLISLSLLGIMMAVYQTAPGWSLLLAPLIFALLIAAAVGVGTLLAALIVVQRDFKYVLHFGVQLWMFATPCLFLGADAIGETARWLLPINPAYGLILNFRQCVLGGPLDLYALACSGGVAVGLLLVGAAYFRRVEKSFADII